MKINAVDLFCGVGGLTYGIQQAGINVVAGYDIDEKSKFAYEYNNDAKFILKDVKDIEDNEILGLYPPDTDIKVLIGCAPCQPFSTYSHKYKNNKNTIKKMDLLDYFGKQVKLVKPDIVSMENVPQLAKETVFKNFIALLESEGYKVSWKIAFAPAYGIPQNRKRLLLLASKFGKISFIKELTTKDYPTIRQAIGDLPKLNAGETDSLDLLHTARNLSDINLSRIRSSKPGGTWRDWDDSLLPECFKRKSGSTYGSVNATTIAEELGKQGLEIDRKIIVMKDAKTVGPHTAVVKLHKDVEVEVHFTVVAEGSEAVSVVEETAPAAETVEAIEAPAEA